MITIIPSGLLESTGTVTYGISTRHGGVSPGFLGMNLSFNVGDTPANVETNRRLFFGALGIDEEQVAIPTQIHSSVVKYANVPGQYPACDGLVTDVVGVFLCVSVADCVPVFVVETEQKIVAAIHAGWRGTSSQIVLQGLALMVEQFRCKPEKMVAHVGPSASACCYSVGTDVAEKFPDEFVNDNKGRVFVDLKAANVSQLAGADTARPNRSESVLHDR